METPNYILKFNDGLMAPKKESLTKDIVKTLFILFCALLLLCVAVFGLEVLKEFPVTVWICVLITIISLKSQGGYERKPSPCELRFYDDYLIQYCERRYYSKRNIRKEIYKFYYKDITRCLYRKNINKIDIFGIVEATFYKYDKAGMVQEKPCKQIKTDSISVFYTVFEPEIDFVKEIETHSPIQVEWENS